MADFYDVVVISIDTREIVSFRGVAMTLDTGRFNARVRQETVESRINEHYEAVVVKTGIYKLGDKVRKEDEV